MTHSKIPVTHQPLLGFNNSCFWHTTHLLQRFPIPIQTYFWWILNLLQYLLFLDPSPSQIRVSQATSLSNSDSSMLDSSPTSIPIRSPGSPFPPSSSFLSPQTPFHCPMSLDLSYDLSPTQVSAFLSIFILLIFYARVAKVHVSRQSLTVNKEQ